MENRELTNGCTLTKCMNSCQHSIPVILHSWLTAMVTWFGMNRTYRIRLKMKVAILISSTWATRLFSIRNHHFSLLPVIRNVELLRQIQPFPLRLVLHRTTDIVAKELAWKMRKTGCKQMQGRRSGTRSRTCLSTFEENPNGSGKKISSALCSWSQSLSHRILLCQLTTPVHQILICIEQIRYNIWSETTLNLKLSVLSRCDWFYG